MPPRPAPPDLQNQPKLEPQSPLFSAHNVTWSLTTALRPGAIALLQLHGPNEAIDALLPCIARRPPKQLGELTLSRILDIDDGLVVRLPNATVQLMLHGGPGVVHAATSKLAALGVYPANTDSQPPDPSTLYPEAATQIEAEALHAIATAASPAAVDALAAQPELWQRWERTPLAEREAPQTILQRSDVLDPLQVAPTVVVVGEPNTGKSSLLNVLVGRSAAIVSDLPGTTRDWVGAWVELCPSLGAPLTHGVAVHWLDTPGLRNTEDPIEAQAIQAARQVIEQADVLIALATPTQGFESIAPLLQSIRRAPDLWVLNKADLLEPSSAPGKDAHQRAKPPTEDEKVDHLRASQLGNSGMSAAAPLAISALHDRGIDTLADAVIAQLGLSECIQSPPSLWAFNTRLREQLARALQ